MTTDESTDRASQGREDRGEGDAGTSGSSVPAPRRASGEQPPVGLTYAESGVDYGAIDPAKISAQRAAAGTAGNLSRWGLSEVGLSRGESAYVWEDLDCYRAMVVEGLGTKSLVADATSPISGRSHYDQLAQDTVAMIVNDIIVVGAEPQVVTAFWAMGDSAWFDDAERSEDLVRGWASACDASGATWGGGETEVLTGVIEPRAVDLAGACVGIVRPKSRLVLGDRLTAGDRIVLLGSSGIHANGLTLARRIADDLPQGYATDVGDGTSYGEALLVPTHLYARLVADVYESGVDVHYLANITGHGWRKLMRAKRNLRYVVERVPEVAPLFRFLQQHGGLTDHEAYGNLNMGAGFAMFVPQEDVATVVGVCERHGIGALDAGCVEEGDREVVIKPIGVSYGGARLQLRS